MRTFSAHHRVTSSGHPLDGGLRGYCGGNLLWEPWAAGYVPKTLGYNRLPPAAHRWGTTHPYQDTTPLLQAKEMGPPT
jgi:hypothetical protein